MKTKEEILKWLRQHDWYQSFKENTIHHNRETFDEYLTELIIKENKPENIIGVAFYWHATSEGGDFWRKINDEYLKWLKTMKQTIEIKVPEGKKAVWKDNKVVFEDIKPELPKTWEEFCEKYPIKSSECVISSGAGIFPTLGYERHCVHNANSLPSQEAAEAHLALMQLHQLRDCYRQGWVPDWEDTEESKWCITNKFGKNGVFSVFYFVSTRFFLAFQKKEIAEKFLHNFESLIEKAGDLI